MGRGGVRGKGGGLYVNVPKLVQSKQPQHNESWIFSMYFVVVGLVGGEIQWEGGVVCHCPLQGNLCHLTQVTLQQTQKQHCPFLPACAIFLHVQTMMQQPVFGICNVRTDVDARFCTWGLYVWMPEDLHWKLTLGEKSLVAPGKRTHTSTAPGFLV